MTTHSASSHQGCSAMASGSSNEKHRAGISHGRRAAAGVGRDDEQRRQSRGGDRDEEEEGNDEGGSPAELERLRDWFVSLPLDDLARALEFSFRADDGEDDGGAGIYGSAGDGGDSSKNHEYDLLAEMVRTQPPPPTPIHPRAISFKPATSRGATDGRSEEARIRSDRYTRPRLFQLAERRSCGGFSDFGVGAKASRKKGGGKKKRRADHSHRPQPKMRGAGGGGGGGGQPQEEWYGGRRRFDVIARRFRSPWGEQLGVGTTERQRTADECLLRGARVWRPRGAGGQLLPPRCSLCLSLVAATMGGRGGSGSGGGGVFDSFVGVGCDRGGGDGDVDVGAPSSSLGIAINAQHVLDLLRIASRGRFLTQAAVHSSEEQLPPPHFCAPWLDHEEWFSLPSYLASRFEVAIRDAYRRSLNHRRRVQATARSSRGGVASSGGDAVFAVVPRGFLPSPIETAIANAAGDETLLGCVHEAARMASSDLLLRYDPRSNVLLGDLDLRKMLEYSPSSAAVFAMTGMGASRGVCDHSSFSRHMVLRLVASILSCPLVEIGNAADSFRAAIQLKLETCLARSAERDLLDSLDRQTGGEETNANGTKENTQVRTNKASKPKKKRKCKKKRQPPRTQTEELNATNEAPKQMDDGDDDSADDLVLNVLSSQTEADRSIPKSASPPDAQCDFPSDERNKNTIVALKMIDLVLDGVFRKVGLPCDDRLSPMHRGGGTHKQGDYHPVTTAQQKKVVKASQKASVVTHGGKLSLQTKMPFPRVNRVAKAKHDSEQAVPKSARSPQPRREINGDVQSPSSAVGLSYANVATKMFPKEGLTPKRKEGCADQHPIPTSPQQEAFPCSSRHKEHPFQNIIDRDVRPHTRQDACGNEDHVHTCFFDVPSVGVSLDLSGAFDGWVGVKPHQRQRSLFAEFFMEEKKDVDQQLIASSTAASIASSSGEEDAARQIDDCGVNAVQDTKPEPVLGDNVGMLIDNGDIEVDNSLSELKSIQDSQVNVHSCSSDPQQDLSSSTVSSLSGSHLSPLLVEAKVATKVEEGRVESPLPSPTTPPPQMSPLLVSLADLGELRKRNSSDELRKELSLSLNTKASVFTGGSVPSSPKVFPPSISLTKTWSKENLSKLSVQEETGTNRSHELSRQADALLSVRKPGTRPFVRTKSVPSNGDRMERDQHFSSPHPGLPMQSGVDCAQSRADGNDSVIGDFHVGDCALSESALEDDKKLHCDERNKSHRFENIASNSEEKSSTSVPPPQPEEEDGSVLRDERNAYRDMCLTLGAEVSKLRNLLASEMCSTFKAGFPYAGPPMPPFFHVNSSLDPEFMPPFFHGVPTGNIRTIAVSDAGVQRGDHDSIRSEDCNGELIHGSVGTESAGMQWRHPPTESGTVAGSDASQDLTSCQFGGNGFRPLEERRISLPLNGLNSRLSTDISNFLQAISSQLKKNNRKRKAAIARINRLVTALWPRAQVKVYGSHVSNLCLPSSDLDFVICLPAVHKNAPADAPGVLEGRNAINESCQKLLARNLKGESWIDPRSIKIIERTVVPVIKVCTKDVRARVLQLDISFDGPQHHGLEAISMVTAVMEEFPVLRPLLLVLKQFLLDRGLLTAYTGGLSSYCLFLMVTRYLQEQSSSWSDCGSMLMGFLDFYGNSFDPSTTGISVGGRRYFSRQHYAQAAFTQSSHEQMWAMPPHQKQHQSAACGLNRDLLRRHSFSTEKNAEAGRFPYVSPPRHAMKPPLGHRHSSSHHTFQNQIQQPQPNSLPSSRPYTFDPLFVEDPLNTGNNVGRNAFRIFQIKRAFADAHRALMASLEWDINNIDTDDMNEDCPYPLLKCLLQNEDIFLS